MNARIAKKIRCFPTDPEQRPGRKNCPFTAQQWSEARRVYNRALGRCRDRGPEAKVKWVCRFPRVWRKQQMAADRVGWKENRRLARVIHENSVRERRENRS